MCPQEILSAEAPSVSTPRKEGCCSIRWMTVLFKLMSHMHGMVVSLSSVCVCVLTGAQLHRNVS